jgi:hypothetical protein
MSAALSTAFFTQMTTDQGASSFYTAVGGRIYHGEGPENATLPLAVYSEIEHTASPFYGGKVMSRVIVEVEVFYDKNAGIAAAAATADKLFTACDQTIVASVTGFDRATIQCTERGVPEVLEDAIGVRTRFSVVGMTT